MADDKEEWGVEEILDEKDMVMVSNIMSNGLVMGTKKTVGYPTTTWRTVKLLIGGKGEKMLIRRDPNSSFFSHWEFFNKLDLWFWDFTDTYIAWREECHVIT
jgi:hypothetical protein